MEKEGGADEEAMDRSGFGQVGKDAAHDRQERQESVRMDAAVEAALDALGPYVATAMMHDAIHDPTAHACNKTDPGGGGAGVVAEGEAGYGALVRDRRLARLAQAAKVLRWCLAV